MSGGAKGAADGDLALQVLQGCITDWRAAMGLPVNATPAVRNPTLHIRLLREECQETVDALLAGDMIGTADGLADIIVIALGAAADCGIDLGPVMAEIMRANWTKYPPTYDEGGKLRKSANYQPPQLGPILRAQGWEPFGDDTDDAEHGASREGGR